MRRLITIIVISILITFMAAFELQAQTPPQTAPGKPVLDPAKLAEEWLNRLPRSGKLELCQVKDYRDGIDRIAAGADVILMTMGHRSDLPILKALHAGNVAITHLGVIGSDAKSKALRRQLMEEGLPPDFIDRIICPVGEKVGNNTPAEIAVGIVSQFLRLRSAHELAKK